MAKQSSFLVIMVVMYLGIISPALVAPALVVEVTGDEGPLPSPSEFASEPASDGPKHTSDIDPIIYTIPPVPAPEFFKKLNVCVQKLTQKCGIQIFHSVFRNKIVIDECCDRLVLMGKGCHDELVESILTIPEFKAMESLIIPRTNHIWNQCVFVADVSPATSLAPF